MERRRGSRGRRLSGVFGAVLTCLLGMPCWATLHEEPPTGIRSYPYCPEQSVAPPKKTRLRIKAVGDVMVHRDQISCARTESEGQETRYDFRPTFERVAPILQEADLTLGNLETTFGGPEKGYSGYPMFSTPDTLADALVEAGFDILTTANNHAFDRREAGVSRTLDVLDGLGLLHTGTSRRPDEKGMPLLVTRNGIRLALLAYTYSTNGVEAYMDPAQVAYLINYMDLNAMRRDLTRARLYEPDFTIVFLHWGVEYVNEPEPEQKRLAQSLLDAGADLVLGCHPHVLQPVARTHVRRGADERDTLIAYSMGNFVSSQRSGFRNTGVILDMRLEKDHNHNVTRLEGLDLVPTWVQRWAENGQYGYRILPVRESIQQYDNGQATHLNSDDYDQLTRSLEHASAILPIEDPTQAPAPVLVTK